MIHDIEFTKKAFDAAKRIDGKDTEYRVIGKPHLRLIVYKNQKSLYVRKGWRGKKYGLTVGTYPIGFKQFERLGNEYCAKVEAGELGSLAARASLSRFFDKAYFPLAKVNKKSWKSDKQRFDTYIRPVIGHYSLNDMQKVLSVQNCLLELPSHLSDRTHDLVRALLSSILSLAIRYELIDKNPVKLVPAKNNCKVRTRTFTDAELEAFIRSCLVECKPDSDSFSFHALCLLLMVLTGMRISECYTAKKSMVAPDLSAIYLPNPKQRKPHTVFLSKQAQWVVKTAMEASWSEWLFPSALKQDEPIAYPRSVFIRICKRAGIAVKGGDHPIQDGFPKEPVSPHCGRKAYCSYILNQTGDVRLASKIIGHSTLSVTEKHYAFYQDARLQSVVRDVAGEMTANISAFPTV